MEWLSKKVVSRLVSYALQGWLEGVTEEQLQTGLANGDLTLTGVSVSRDALLFLDAYYGNSLPVEVLKGSIGELHLSVQYDSLFTSPVVLQISDVLLVVGPSTDPPSVERLNDIERASKRVQLNKIFPTPQQKSSSWLSWSSMVNFLLDKLQLSVSNVHVRYEDRVSAEHPLAMGLCLKTLEIASTNSKWKKSSTDTTSRSLHKIIDFSGVCAYMNPQSDAQRMVSPHLSSPLWQEYMKLGLNSYTINSEPFKFVMEPVRCKIKLKQQRLSPTEQAESRVPALLVDSVFKGPISVAVSKEQLAALSSLSHSFACVARRRHYWEHRPLVPLRRHAVDWWHYALRCVVGSRIRPFSWRSIKRHRANYRQYVELYMKHLTDAADSVTDAKLEQLEDQLCVLNITIARSEAKIRVGRERPELVEPQPSKAGFISWLFGRTASQEECDVVGGQAQAGLLHDLTEEERQMLHDSIRKLHGSPSPVPDGEALIEQKIYVIAQNVSVSLVEEHREVALASLTGLGFNYESRSAIAYQKLSFKLDSFLIEGCSLENDLVSVVKPIEETYSRGYGFAFSCDYEVNPKPGLANHSLTTKLLPLEIVYNESAFSSLQSFLDIPGLSSQSVKEAALNTSEELLSSTKASLLYALSRKTTYYLDIDIKSPYLVLPEHGSLQRGGNVLVIDMGGLQVNTETGGAFDAEDGATMSEIEEKLYDRINITIPQLQVLFSDSGDEWRALRASDDSVLHLLPRVRVNAFLANSIHPSYRELPQQKVDLRVTPVKINVSEKRITHLNEFWKNFPLPSSQCDQVDSYMPEKIPELENWTASYDMSLLSNIRRQLSVKTAPKDPNNELNAESRVSSTLQQLLYKKSVDEISETSAELQLYFPSSDNSDDEVDGSVPAKRTLDLPGFDENVSPHNKIKILARVRVEEITFGISRSNSQTDRPYLMLKISHSIAEIATMDHGCAIQLHFGSLHLVDKFHNSPDGEYLELISSPADQRVLTIHFRETDAKCPDFTTHFQSTERKLIMSVATLNFVWHRGSIITLINFLKHSSSKFQMNVEVPEVKLDDPIPTHLLANKSSHPVPPGALKWSVAAYVSAISLKMCDTEVDVLEAKIAGLQTRYSFKANERKTFQISVENIIIDDRSDMTLYNRILEVEEDFAFDIKYEELSPKVADTYSSPTNNENASNKPESSLDFKVGKIQLVLLSKFLADLLRFVDPVIPKERPPVASKNTLSSNESLIDKILSKRVLHRWDIRALTFLIPQKSDSPSLLTINTGSLKVENMFTAAKSENMLVELGPFQIGRSVLKLSEGIEMQEAIFEPAKFRCDIKRCRDSHNREMHAWDVKVQLGTVRINIGQRDLSVVLGVLSENKAEAQFEITEMRSRAATPTIVVTDDTDENVRKLHAFLTSVDIYKKSTGNVILDGLVVTLYTDMDEQWSSPVRDAAAALARLDVGEIELRADMYSNSSLKAHLTVASCDVFDVRPESSNVAKRIFGQSIEYTASTCDGVYISSPLLLDISLSRTANGDTAVEMTLEKTRVNLSANVCSSINKYIMGALPSPDAKRGLENPGFTEDSTMAAVVLRPHQRPSSSEGSTSGYLSSVTSSTSGSTVSTFSILIKPVQILVHPEPEKYYSPVLLLYLELTVDYSRHPAYENWKIYTQDASVSSVIYSSKKQTPYRIIEPFEVTLTLNSKYPENDEKCDIQISKISVHLNSCTLGMTKKFVSDLSEAVNPQVIFPELRLPSADLENLWVPKALFANSINLDSDESTLSTKLVHFGRKESTVLNLKPTNIEVFLEDNVANNPVFMIEGSVSSAVKDWSFSGTSKTIARVKICCFNPKYSCWEPLLETNSKREQEKPFEITISTEKCVGRPIGVSKSLNKTDDKVDTAAQSVRSQRTASYAQSSGSSSDSDDQCDSEMVILRAPRQRRQKNTSSFRVRQYSRALSGQTSDSDSEDAVIHQLSSAFTHLFSSDSEEGDSSDDCSSPDLDLPEDAATDNEGQQDAPLPPHEGRGSSEEDDEDGLYNSDAEMMDSVDGGPAAQPPLSTYVMLLAAEPLQFTLTPRMVRCCRDLLTQYTEDCLDAPAPPAPTPAGGERTELPNMHILNDIGPHSSVTLFVATHEDARGDEVRWRPVRVVHYGDWSTPSSPASLSRPVSRDDLDSSEDQLAAMDWDAVELDLEPACPASAAAEQHAPKPEFTTDYIELFRRLSKYKIKVSVPGFEPLVAYVGSRSRTRLFQLRPSDSARPCCPLFLTVDNHNADTHVTVSSPLKIINTTCMPINLCYRKSSLAHCALEDTSHLPPIASPSNPFETHPSLTTLQPDEEYTVPLLVAYHSALYLQPAASEYSVSREGAWWQDARTAPRPLMITCTKAQDQMPMTFAVALEKGKWLSSLQQDEALACGSVADYTLKIQAPVVVHNHLPYTLELRHPHLSQPRALDPGSATAFHHFDPESRLTLQLQVNNYLGKDWKGNLVVSSEKVSDIRSVSLTDTEVGRKMELLARCVSCPAFAIFIHTPYWVVNKTGLTLYVQGAKKAEYKSESQDQILLYKYKQNTPTKIRVREEESDWSRHWNPDAVGTDGVVFCPDRKRAKKYRLCVTSQMAALSASICSADGPLVKSTSKEHLTTLVTLSPYFMVRNLTNRPLRFMEDNDKMDLWHDLEPRQCKAFWPEQDKQLMVAQHKDGRMRSLAFHYNSEHKTVLRTEKGRALVVKVGRPSPQEPMLVSFEPYSCGDAPVRIENWCDDLVLRVRQLTHQVTLVQQRQSLLYTWDDPNADRELYWSAYDEKRKEFTALIKKSGSGSELITIQTTRNMPQRSRDKPKMRPVGATKTTFRQSSSSSDEGENPSASKKETVRVYWVSYMDGLQRVLLFSQKPRLAAISRALEEQASLEFVASLSHVGLSLITEKKEELCYLSLQSSPAEWEVMMAGKFKSVPSLELATWLEYQYQNCKDPCAYIQGSLQVNFASMTLEKPFLARLRRQQSPAVWLHFRRSPHYSGLSVACYKLQVDNQLLGAHYPTVLCSAPAASVTQPCLSLRTLMHYPASGPPTLRHLSLLGTEFILKMDGDFYLRAWELYCELVPPQPPCLRTQLKLMHTPLAFYYVQSGPETASQFDVLVERACVAGLSISLSYFPATHFSYSADQDPSWLCSLPASLLELKDVKLSIGQYHRENRPLNDTIHDFLNVSYSQLMQQKLVLALGLDILGNPYQRLRSLTEGVCDVIYDPDQGLLEEPDAYEWRVARRIRRLLSLVVGGVGGVAESSVAVARVVSNVVAKAVLNPQEQMERHLRVNAGERRVRSAEWERADGALALSVMAGSCSSASLQQPPGLRSSGLRGFFSGAGRGVHSLISKPALGVLDSAAFALDAVRRALTMGVEVTVQQRLPRHLGEHSSVQAYSEHSAQGRALLTSLCSGAFALTDTYCTHRILTPHERFSVAIVSNRNVFLVERCSATTMGELSWRVCLKELATPPTIAGDSLSLSVRGATAAVQNRAIKSTDDETLVHLRTCIETLVVMEMEDHPCPDTKLLEDV